MGTTYSSDEARAILRFYQEAGLDTAEADVPGALWGNEGPSSSKALSQRPAANQAPAQEAPARAAPIASTAQPVTARADEALSAAESAASACSSLDELVAAITAFDGCPLKEGARGPVVYDGVLGADILIIGEAPGREEDRMGKPFVGRSGQLLDLMLAAIGLARAPEEGQAAVCITNVVYWRPPGNRNPSAAELAVCMPFARRFVELTRPRLVLTAGKVPTTAFFPEISSIVRSRGQFQTIALQDGTEIPALPIFHPAFLLRQPAQKRWAWKDLQAAQSKLNNTLP